MIKEKDLIGQLEKFPIQVVKKMLERQVQQGNAENVRVFQECNYADKSMGGFTWSNTLEGVYFWNDVISHRNFEVFFEKYPELYSEVWIRVLKIEVKK